MRLAAAGDVGHLTRERIVMTLSVCCLTSDPGPRVAAILRQLRPVADEIVLAVDSRLDPDRLGRYADVADVLMRYEFVDSVEQSAPFVVAHCSGDWILRIDGDEVLSPALIERLPELTSARDVFQYWLTCRWLFPDANHYLAQPPWHYSSPRLVRNDPATLWHPGLSHGRFEPVFPSVRLAEGYYHLTLLVHDLAYREAKVERYLSISSGHSRRVLEDDVTAFYLPERDRRFGPDPVAVPACDRAAIAEVLEAAGEERPGPAAAGIPMWRWSAIQGLWPRRVLPEDAYRGEIEPFERALRIACEQQRAVTVSVANKGGEMWPGMDREPAIRLSHRWLDPEGSAVGEWVDTQLPAALAAGATVLVPFEVQAPATAGLYGLELALSHEDLLSGQLLRRFAATVLTVEVERAERGARESSQPDAPERAPRRSLRRLAGRVLGGLS